ncbi:MAG: hypothetical protein ABEJ72_02225 [Candidatus Aenigmatarchaeota archaeon]
MALTDGLLETEIRKVDELVINRDAKKWCNLPYPDHEDGCPNYGEKEVCPPNAPDIEEFIDMDREKWFVVGKFDIGKFEERMGERHPDWSSKKKRCNLYWQKSVKKKIRNVVEEFKASKDGEFVSTELPEALGVQVFATARNMGIPIKKDPDKYIYKISLVGRPP